MYHLSWLAMCFAGPYIARKYIPDDYKYLFGFIFGYLSEMLYFLAMTSGG